MIVNADVKGLELHTAAFLSRDSVLIKELHDKFDLHTDNQEKFVLPDRKYAKFFVFRLLFGGTANGFYYDMDFKDVGYNLQQWQAVVDKFYNKYEGIGLWHTNLIREAVETGKISMVTGRFYTFKPYSDYRGNIKWPETQIKNYPVQGLGADLMVLYRIILKNLLRNNRLCLMISSVHDSVVVDCPKEDVSFVADCMFKAASIVPHMFKEKFGVEWDLPFLVEVGYGKNMKDLIDITH